MAAILTQVGHFYFGEVGQFYIGADNVISLRPRTAFVTHSSSSAPLRLLDQVREIIRIRHYSIRTEQAYVHWIRRFILFHDKRHPRDMGAPELTAFLSDLAIKRNVAASTQKQALNALLFLYRDVLKLALPWLDGIERAKKPQRLPGSAHAQGGKCAAGAAGRDTMAHVRYPRSTRTVQELLGHADVKTTMIYTHVLNRGGTSRSQPSGVRRRNTDQQSSPHRWRRHDKTVC